MVVVVEVVVVVVVVAVVVVEVVVVVVVVVQVTVCFNIEIMVTMFCFDSVVFGNKSLFSSKNWNKMPPC